MKYWKSDRKLYFIIEQNAIGCWCWRISDSRHFVTESKDHPDNKFNNKDCAELAETQKETHNETISACWLYTDVKAHGEKSHLLPGWSWHLPWHAVYGPMRSLKLILPSRNERRLLKRMNTVQWSELNSLIHSSTMCISEKITDNLI